MIVISLDVSIDVLKKMINNFNWSWSTIS